MPQINYCDIIIPVFNRLDYVLTCIDSVLEHTDYPYRIIIVDSGSDTFVKERLRGYFREFTQVKLIESPINIGFVKSVNRGIRESTGPYVVLLSSDMVITPGWLDKMVKCAKSASKIAIVSPVTNKVNNLSVQMPPGYNIFSLAKKFEKVSTKEYPDVVAPSVSCFMMKRQAIEKFWEFDEQKDGYSEKSDCFEKITEADLRIVIADDTFVFNKGAAPLFHKSNRCLKNSKNSYALDYIRQKLTENLEAIPQTKITLFKHLLIKFWRAYKCIGLKNIVVRISPSLILNVFSSYFSKSSHAKKQINAHRTSAAKKDFFVTKDYISKLPKPRKFSAIYLVENLALYGGVISVVQLVNELILNGYDASIVTLNEEPDPDTFGLYTTPIRYKTLKDMAEFFPKADIVVATFWTTANFWVPSIIARNPGIVPFYFIQDFESWFYPDKSTRQKVLDTYKVIPNKIVKSLWLQGKLDELGYPSHRIHLGLDLGIFYPRDTRKNEKKRILLMAQPYKKRRGLKEAIDVFSRIHSTYPEVEFVFFGCNDKDLRNFRITFPYINKGVVRDQNQVAGLYSSCDVFFDASLFQGFGRPGLESMACGTPPVLTNVGGVNEYARDGENCLMVSPANLDEAVEAITRLLKGDEFYENLKRNGIESAKKFCHQDEAMKHMELYKRIIGNRKENALRSNI